MWTASSRSNIEGAPRGTHLGSGATLKPILQSLLIADRIYTDKESGKKIIAGIFQKLVSIPNDVVKDLALQGNAPFRQGFQAGSPYAYVSMTDVRGEQEFALRYVALETDSVAFEVTFKVSCDDPLATVEIDLPLPPLPSHTPGVFALELLWGANSEPIGLYRIQVVTVTATGESHDSSNGTTGD